jgi:hypothetical protein
LVPVVLPIIFGNKKASRESGQKTVPGDAVVLGPLPDLIEYWRAAIGPRKKMSKIYAIRWRVIFWFI